LADGCFLFLHFALFFEKRLMLFQKLIEQHRVDRVVAHSVDLAILVAHHEIGVHLCHFLSD
jgi:hypothetical protein